MPTIAEPRALTPNAEGAGARLRVVVADDHPLYRAGIVRALESTEAFDVVAQVADGRAALELIRTLVPDVALLDVRMPAMDGIDVVAALARSGPPVPVVLLSAFDERSLIQAGLDAGSTRYLVKSADREEICLELAAAARSARAQSPTALHGAADLAPGRVGPWRPRLTIEQHRLLALAAARRPYEQLASAMGLDEPTVRRRADELLARLGVDSLEDAVSVARRAGLIDRASDERQPG